MIRNFIKKAPTIIDKIEAAPFDFYLGGSRRMAERSIQENSPTRIEISSATDYDFYANSSEALVKWLQDNGFLRSRDHYELDTEALEIYKYIGSGVKVDVVLRKDAQFYSKVFESIPLDFYYHFLWKSADGFNNESRRREVIDALFAVARAFKGEK